MTKLSEKMFKLLPDTVIVTDAYWYVIDFNRKGKIDNLKKWVKLTESIPMDLIGEENEIHLNGSTYLCTITQISNKDNIVGYTVYLVDISEEKRIYEENRRNSEELNDLIEEQLAANAKLEEYASQVKALSEYSEQLRIAKMIHDGSGHTITALHTISQMCLKLKETDKLRFMELVKEGIEICDKGTEIGRMREFDSLAALLKCFKDEAQIEMEIILDGEEPSFVRNLYEIVYKICREAYHNTLSHSLAEKMMIHVKMQPYFFSLIIEDNGCFHGAFEKGFGLSTMEENIASSGGSVIFRADDGKGFGIEASWEVKNER